MSATSASKAPQSAPRILVALVAPPLLAPEGSLTFELPAVAPIPAAAVDSGMTLRAFDRPAVRWLGRSRTAERPNVLRCVAGRLAAEAAVKGLLRRPVGGILLQRSARSSIVRPISPLIEFCISVPHP